MVVDGDLLGHIWTHASLPSAIDAHQVGDARARESHGVQVTAWSATAVPPVRPRRAAGFEYKPLVLASSMGAAAT